MTPSSDIVASVSALHDRLRTGLPWLRTLATKVAQVHGERQPELRELDAIVGQLYLALGAHLEFDEALLLPALRGGPADGRELASLAAEHLELRRLLDELRVTADHFRAPDWACLTYRRLMGELQTFEADLLASIHLENHAAAELWTQEEVR